MASHPNSDMSFSISPASTLPHRKRKWTPPSPTATGPPNSALPSSSSSLDPEIKYDVFISFRGTDTRSRFLSHLRAELSRRKIDFFVDDEKLAKGDNISFTLLNAIVKSEFSLVVFSEDYASSKWCLEELEQIMQCKENQGQIVVPIFYDVNPSTVRHQMGSFKDAFDKHGERFDEHRLQKWKTALKEACNLSAFVSSNDQNEAILIKEVGEHVSNILKKMREPSDLKGFVEMHEKIQDLEARLGTKPEDIFIIGIWGMGGIGKTTIVEILFDRLCNKYEGSHFLNVREELKKHGSIGQLKKELLSVLLNEKVHDVMINDISTDIRRRLRRKKVLVILDDIYESNQLEVLTGGGAWFGPGSRIIMTSRDKHVFSKECKNIYEFKPLDSEQALQLFKNVLGEDCLAREQEHNELLGTVINYAKGVPLVIKVLGRYLCDKDRNGWKSKLEKLDRFPDADIQEVLELSYNEIKDDQHGEIFLYLAWFFRREFKGHITSLLDACGYSTIDGLGVLQDKALISITHGYVTMHDLIRDMGYEIVRKKSPKDPGQRIHLFDAADICEVFEKNKGTGTVESIRLNVTHLKNDLNLGPQAFARMDNLKFLLFDDDWIRKNKVWPPEEGFESLPDELRYFHWARYPLKSFPLRCCLKNLVELRLPRSNLQKLWDGVQDLPELRLIDLSYSKNLTEIPDLSKAPKLESAILSHCEMLSHDSLWPNRNTVEQDMTECGEPTKIGRDSQVSLTSFTTEESEKHDHLDSCYMSLVIKPSVKYYVLTSLQHLIMNSCPSLIELHEEIGFCLPSLQSLELAHTMVETLPTSIRHLSQLILLEVSSCSRLRYMPELPPSICSLYAEDCSSLETLQFSTSNLVPPSHQDGVFNLMNCVKLGENTLEAATMHYECKTRRIIAAGREGCSCTAEIWFPGSKVPKCFSRYRATQDLVSDPLQLPLNCKALGFIFYFVILQNRRGRFGSWQFQIQCHIELNNVEEVKFIYRSPPKVTEKRGLSWKMHSRSLKKMKEVSRIKASVTADDLCPNAAVLWYEHSLSVKIMKEVSRIKASVTADDLCPKIWFELLGYNEPLEDNDLEDNELLEARQDIKEDNDWEDNELSEDNDWEDNELSEDNESLEYNELLEDNESLEEEIIEWGVYPIFFPSESHGLIDTERFPDIIGRDDD